MRKKFILLAIISLLVSCENNNDQLQDAKTEFDKNIVLFLESVEIIPQKRTKNSYGEYFKTFILKLNDLNYKPLKSYALNGEEFVDDGTINDLVKNDGIYTSVLTDETDVKFDLSQNISFKSDKFKYNDNQIFQKSNGGEFGCKIKHVRTGKSLLGFSCAANIGCFELTDCSFKITW